MDDRHIMFDEKMFEQLISGEIIEVGNVKIALQDIGYDLMIQIILEKMKGMKLFNANTDG